MSDDSCFLAVHIINFVFLCPQALGDSRKRKLHDTGDLFRFFAMVRNLMLWMDDLMRQASITKNDKVRYLVPPNSIWGLFSYYDKSGNYRLSGLTTIHPISQLAVLCIMVMALSRMS